MANDTVRYYFHVVHNSMPHKDKWGQGFADVEAARKYAAKIASELAVERDLDGATLRVVDEHGNEVASLKIASHQDDNRA